MVDIISFTIQNQERDGKFKICNRNLNRVRPNNIILNGSGRRSLRRISVLGKPRCNKIRTIETELENYTRVFNIDLLYRVRELMTMIRYFMAIFWNSLLDFESHSRMLCASSHIIFPVFKSRVLITQFTQRSMVRLPTLCVCVSMRGAGSNYNISLPSEMTAIYNIIYKIIKIYVKTLYTL